METSVAALGTLPSHFLQDEMFTVEGSVQDSCLPARPEQQLPGMFYIQYSQFSGLVSWFSVFREKLVL